jgi:hypothetical protein
MDNGRSVSFIEHFVMPNEDPCPISCIVSKLSKSGRMARAKWSTDGWLECELRFISGPEWARHEITCLAEVQSDPRSDRTTYSFSCYRVDNVRLSDWLRSHPGAAAERVKSTIFFETVMRVVEIKQATL